MQRLLLIVITSTLLQAEKGIPEEALGSIYTEALWFIGVITVMGIISFVVSSRNAKRYEAEMALKQVQLKKKETEKEAEIEKPLFLSRITELEELRDKGLLKNSEFSILKRHLIAK